MARRQSLLTRALHFGVPKLIAITCIIALVGAACQATTPANTPAPTLTSPPPATPAPTPTPPPPTEPVEPTAAPSASAPPEQTRPPTPTIAPTVAVPPPAVSEAVVADTGAQVLELTERLLWPRTVDADFLWGLFIANRSFGSGAPGQVEPDYTARMLALWHPENVCYSMLESAIASLDAENGLHPLEFVLYVDHIAAELSPCLDEQLLQVGPEQFFTLSTDVRTHRINAWFDSIWRDANDQSFALDAVCRDEFYSNLSDAVGASDPSQLETAWVSAMVAVSGCAREAMRDYFAFIQLDTAQVFAMPPDERYTTVSLQMTMTGHMIAISQSKPYQSCWPDYEANIPRVAAAGSPSQLDAIRNATLQTLFECLDALPAVNPFAGQ